MSVILLHGSYNWERQVLNVWAFIMTLTEGFTAKQHTLQLKG